MSLLSLSLSRFRPETYSVGGSFDSIECFLFFSVQYRNTRSRNSFRYQHFSKQVISQSESFSTLPTLRETSLISEKWHFYSGSNRPILGRKRKDTIEKYSTKKLLCINGKRKNFL